MDEKIFGMTEEEITDFMGRFVIYEGCLGVSVFILGLIRLGCEIEPKTLIDAVIIIAVLLSPIIHSKGLEVFLTIKD